LGVGDTGHRANDLARQDHAWLGARRSLRLRERQATAKAAGCSPRLCQIIAEEI